MVIMLIHFFASDFPPVVYVDPSFLSLWPGALPREDRPAWPAMCCRRLRNTRKCGAPHPLWRAPCERILLVHI